MFTRALQKKTFLLLLCLCATAFLFFACKDGEETKKPTGNGNQVVTDSTLAEFEELDYKDDEIVISLSEYTWAEIPLESHQYISGPDRAGSDPVLNLIYERNRNIEKAINLLPRYVYTNLAHDKIAQDIDTQIMMPSKDTPDLYIDQVRGLARAQMNNNFVNVLGKSETSHFDFGSKTENVNGWYNAYMNGFNFASDEKMYLLAGDYFMDVIRMLNLMGANLSNFDALFLKGDPENPDLGTGRDYLYNTVKAGNWTLDQMLEWSNTAYKDLNNNSIKDEKDRLGLMTFNNGPSSMGILPSNDISLFHVSKDNKSYTVGQNQAAIDAINAWQKVFASRGAYVMISAQGGHEYDRLINAFIDGEVLFITGLQLFQTETDVLKGMEDQKCLIPYPKVKADNDYCVITHDNARVGAILKTTAKFEQVSAWVQAASISSVKILDKYYNETVKYKNGADYGSTEMLDIIYENISNPKWIVDTAILQSTNTTLTNKESPVHGDRVTLDRVNNYASNYTAVASKLTSALNSYKAKFNALN